MTSNRLIATLSLCLVAVLSAYFYSTLSTNQTIFTASNTTSSHTLGPRVSGDAQATLPADTHALLPSAVITQPDKALPLPAHQLTKVLAAQATLTRASLDEKITAANQRIQSMDPAFSRELPPPTATINPESNSDHHLQQRIDHIKQYLNNTSSTP